MTSAPTADLNSVVREQLQAILSDPMQRQALVGGSQFGPEQADLLDKHEAQINALLQDNSLGRILNGPLWLSGTSVVDGTITADKISVNSLDAITVNSGDINVTGDLIASASFPAVGARVVLNSSGLWGYSGGATTTFKLNVDGSGEIGTAPNPQISWTTGGVVTIPAAIVGSLTIADVGSGTFGGTYQSGAGTTRFEINTTYLRALASGTETFKLLAATGAMTATGAFTILSSATGAHITVDNAGGIAGYKNTTENAANRTFLINAVDGSGHLGLNNGTPAITWDSAGTVSVGGVALSGGKITASSLSVSTLSAVTANMGTLTAGSITGGTITASTINAGTLTFNAGGTINGGGASVAGTIGNSGGTLNIGKLTITDQLTLSGGSAKIVDSNGSFWDVNGIVLVSAGSVGDSIQWKTSGTTRGSIVSTTVDLLMGFVSGGVFAANMSIQGTKMVFDAGGANNDVVFRNTGNVEIRGRVYPGTQSGSPQTSVYLASGGTHGDIVLSDTAGASQFRIFDSTPAQVWGVDSNGAMQLPGSNGAALGAYQGKVPVVWNGGNYFIGIYA